MKTAPSEKVIFDEGSRPGYPWDVDHGQDLQPGGVDDRSNFRYLDANVDRSEAARVSSLIRRFDVPDRAGFDGFRFEQRGVGIWTGGRSTSWIGASAAAAH